MLKVLVNVLSRDKERSIFTAFTNRSVWLEVKLFKLIAHQAAVVPVHFHKVLGKETRLTAAHG